MDYPFGIDISKHQGTNNKFYRTFNGEYTNRWNQAGVNLVVNQMLSDLENQ